MPPENERSNFRERVNHRLWLAGLTDFLHHKLKSEQETFLHNLEERNNVWVKNSH